MANKSLGDIAEIIMGQSPPSDTCNTDGVGVPLLNGPTEYGLHHPLPVQFTTEARKIARSADILFCVRGSTTGRMNWADREYAIGRGVAAIRHKQDTALNPFVRAVIEYGLPSLLAQATGSTFPNVSATQLIDLWCPPFTEEEQRAIAHILSSLDDRIELNRRMNETLEGMAYTIFKSWFVNFDPVRAKAEGRQPFGMDAETAALFPDSFQKSSHGEIPKSWETGPILVYAKLLSGGTPKTHRNDYWNGHIQWASAKDVSQCEEPFLVRTERTITEKGLAESATQLIPQFCTVVVARGATTGRMSLLGAEMAINQTCYALATTSRAPFFLYCLLRSEIGGLVHAAHGSVFDTITTATFKSSQVLLPAETIVRAFEVTVAPFFGRILTNVMESSSLAAIRHALLPKLISGEIRVKQGKKTAEATV